MTNRIQMEQSQMSLVHPDLVPGELVRFTARSAWHFGVLVGIDGTFAVVSTHGGDKRERVPTSAVHPWPPAQ